MPSSPPPAPEVSVAPRRSILVLVSARSGGDKPPVLALAAGLRDRGHHVHLLCDGDVAAAVASTGLPVVDLPRALRQETFYDRLLVSRMAQRGETIAADTPDPLVPWAWACLPPALAAARPLRPRLLLSTLFCMSLADRLASELRVPWVFVNPSFYFGEDARRPWEADFPGVVGGVFRHWFLPLVRRADAVLHATDPAFDPPPAGLPPNHHYVGPLDREPPPVGTDTAFLDETGAPWVLVTLSTSPQAGELALARAALDALAERPVRVLLTLAPGHPRDELGPVPANARVDGFVPHGTVLDRARLMVGHAGHGMVAKALRHGVPMVLVPWGRDQPGVAARAEAMGAAAVVPRADCTAERLAEAVARVLGEPGYAKAARRASERLRSDDPLGRACGIVERLVRGDGAPPRKGASPASPPILGEGGATP
jgi:UDP:flavonoid glycosyltransferase YjiC (YdhE family)